MLSSSLPYEKEYGTWPLLTLRFSFEVLDLFLVFIFSCLGGPAAFMLIIFLTELHVALLEPVA